jgi:glucose dehydrogenase
MPSPSPTGVSRGHEAAPIVADNTMYIVGPYPNPVYALDLTKPGAPLKWKFEPKPEPRAGRGLLRHRQPRRRLCRRPHLLQHARQPDHRARCEATGKELWRTKLGDIKLKGETMTMAPLVVKDKVLVGNSGGEFGVRGWLTALDAATGKIAWRAYSTGPDKDVLIGPELQALLRATAARTWA